MDSVGLMPSGPTNAVIIRYFLDLQSSPAYHQSQTDLVFCVLILTRGLPTLVFDDIIWILRPIASIPLN